MPQDNAKPPDIGQTPDWTTEASGARALSRGLAAAVGTAGLILAASSAGFGALARDAGFSIDLSVFTMIVFFALPAQVVFIDQWARDASLFAGALAVCLSSVRLLPMTVTIMPLLSPGKADGEKPTPRRPNRLRLLLAVHFVAVTAWMEGMRRLPPLPARLRLAYFIGLGSGLVAMTVAGTIIGYQLAASVPVWISAVLLFLTPVYFLLSLIATARASADWLAIGLGMALGPVAYIYAPAIDLLVAGLVGGTIAYIVGARAPSPPKFRSDKNGELE